MKERNQSSRRAWLDLERFRSARAFGQGGCILAGLFAISSTIGLLIRP